MKRETWSLLTAALTIVAVMAAPSAASARFHDDAPIQSAVFKVVGSNGYEIYVKSERNQVTVTASQQRPPVATISNSGHIQAANKGTLAANTYVAFHQPEDPGVIEADLGPLGRISVRFQPSGRTHVAKLDLSGKSTKCVAPTRIVRRLGVFTGTIRFTGENGYTSVDLASAPGTVGTSPFRNCTTKPAPRSASNPIGSASAVLRPTDPFLTALGQIESTDSSVSFSAIRGSDGKPRFFAASGEPIDTGSTTTVGGPFVMRMAQAVGPRGAFTATVDGETATVKPTGPFSGVARLKGSQWSGDLMVSFPGLKAALVGPSFKVKLRTVGR